MDYVRVSFRSSTGLRGSVDPTGGLPIDSANWSSGWLPAVYQGTVFRSGPSPVLNLQSPDGVAGNAQKPVAISRKTQSTATDAYPENTELTARNLQI